MNCPICQSNPCYLICPNADPYAGNPAAEHEDHEFGARFDDVRERFAGESGEFFDGEGE